MGQSTRVPFSFRNDWLDANLNGNSYFVETTLRYRAKSWGEALQKCRRQNAGLGHFISEDYESLVAAYVRSKTSIIRGTKSKVFT